MTELLSGPATDPLVSSYTWDLCVMALCFGGLLGLLVWNVIEGIWEKHDE
jgi:hypothetical protein